MHLIDKNSDAFDIKLIESMISNCANGTYYDDPLRSEKASALRRALKALKRELVERCECCAHCKTVCGDRICSEFRCRVPVDGHCHGFQRRED